MSTQADRATALGTPPDRVETPAANGIGFTSHTHEMMNIPPSQIRRLDIYKHDGLYRTVSSVIAKQGGGMAVYFRSDDGPEQQPADISEGVYAVSVWRPKETDSYV